MFKSSPTKLPPKPVEPDPSECCGRGCERCVFIYYEEALKKWEKKLEEISRKTGN